MLLKWDGLKKNKYCGSLCWNDWKKYEDPIELSLGHIDLSVIGRREGTDK